MDEAASSLPTWCTKCRLICGDSIYDIARDKFIRRCTMVAHPKLVNITVEYLNGDIVGKVFEDEVWRTPQ